MISNYGIIIADMKMLIEVLITCPTNSPSQPESLRRWN